MPPPMSRTSRGRRPCQTVSSPAQTTALRVLPRPVGSLAGVDMRASLERSTGCLRFGVAHPGLPGLRCQSLRATSLTASPDGLTSAYGDIWKPLECTSTRWTG